MGGVCKVWQIIHRNILITITNDSYFMGVSFNPQLELW